MYAHAEKERKRAKVALKSERDAIRQNLNFIDMISHEYRTPLSGLSSSIDILEKKCSMIEYRDFDDQLRKMRISIQRLIDVFESSLGKERMDKLTPQLSMENLNLVQIIDSAIELTKTAYLHHKIIFDSEMSRHVQVTGDEKLLVTVFSNLLDNACKYSEATGQIRISVTPGETHVEIFTIDSGMGIDEDEIPLVFGKYFRSQHTGVKQGAGLGLFLVKKIIALHHGEIKLTSQRNMGTQISVLLPMEKNHKYENK
jgi:signal transduction histidine kinase